MNIFKSISQFLFIFLLILLSFGCKEPAVDQNTNQDQVTVRLRADPGGLNLFLASTGYTTEVCNNIFSPLSVFNPENLRLEPFLIKSNPVIKTIEEGANKGGIEFIYEIIEEAKWDNGQPVLASDYIFTLKILMNPKVPTPHYRAYFSFLRDVIVDQDNPRKFTIITANPYILAEPVLSNLEIYPEYVYDPKGLLKPYSLAELCQPDFDFSDREAQLDSFATQFTSNKYAFDVNYIRGCGPYNVEEILPDQRIVLSRKKNWWGDALAQTNPLYSAGPQKIIFKPIPDEASSISLLKNQELDAMGSIPSDQFLKLKTDEQLQQHYNFHTPLAMSYAYIGLNTKDQKLNDKRVRRALAHLTPIDEIIKTSLSGLAQRINGPVLPTKFYYHNDLPLINFDIQKAKALLDEAGWKDSNGDGIRDQMIDGQIIELRLNYLNSTSNPTGTNFGILMKDHARKAGVDIELKEMEFKSMVKEYKQRNFDMVFITRRRPPIPDDFMQSWHTSSDRPNGSNRIGFGNADSDALIEKIRTTLASEEQTRLYRKFQEIVYNEQPCIFLLTNKERIIIHKRFDAAVTSLAPGFFPKYFKSTVLQE